MSTKAKREPKTDTEQPEEHAPARIQLPAVIENLNRGKPPRLTWDKNTSMIFMAIALVGEVTRGWLVDLMARFGYAEGTVSAALFALHDEGFIIRIGGGRYAHNAAMEGQVHTHAERRRSGMRSKTPK